jgi:two-component system, LuxR family, response regulator FixJ
MALSDGNGCFAQNEPPLLRGCLQDGGPKGTVLVAVREEPQRIATVSYLESLGYKAVIVSDCGAPVVASQTYVAELIIVGATTPESDVLTLARKLREAVPDLPMFLMTVRSYALGKLLLDCAMALGALSAERQFLASSKAAPNLRDGICELPKLTHREREVLDLVVCGHANKTIGRLLSISHRTVENHRARIMRKTSSNSVAELVRKTINGGNAGYNGPYAAVKRNLGNEMNDIFG